MFKSFFVFLFSGILMHLYAQQPSIQYFRPNDRDGLNVFEPSKIDTVQYDGMKVRLGGDFAMQFQGLTQSNTPGNLVDLGYDFNLPAANLNLDVQLLDGVRMHLRTYLSSRHHNEAWIKGGHVQFDNLDFIKPGFMSGVMKNVSFTVGLDEFNYGDAHFRRSDNARTIFNPFVGNYIMDAFSTEAFGEATTQYKGWLLVMGLTNGKLNQTTVMNQNTDNQPSVYGKFGFDKQLTEDFRFRLTGSWYINQGTTTGTWLYGGDRAGSRYYNVLHTLPDIDGNTQGGSFDGRYNARYTKITALQLNPFVKYKGFEFFGIYEWANGDNTEVGPGGSESEGSFTQIAGEALYRFGNDERFYIGGRYNTVFGKQFESDAENREINRFNIGGGWFISQNILAKVEYVDQRYEGSAWAGRFQGANFRGINVEAAISF